MSVDSYLSDLEREKGAVRSEKSSDLKQLAERKGAMNQGFTIHIFALSDISAVHGDTSLFRTLATDENYDLPVGTVANAAAEQFEGRIAKFGGRYHLENAADLMEQLADVLREVDDEAEFVKLMRETREYLNYLQYQIGARIPFHELGVVFEGRQPIDEQYYEH